MTEPRLFVCPLTCLFIKGSFKPKWIYKMMKGQLKTLQPLGGSQSVIRLAHGWNLLAKREQVLPHLTCFYSQLTYQEDCYTQGRITLKHKLLLDQLIFTLPYLLFLCLI